MHFSSDAKTMAMTHPQVLKRDKNKMAAIFQSAKLPASSKSLAKAVPP